MPVKIKVFGYDGANILRVLTDSCTIIFRLHSPRISTGLYSLIRCYCKVMEYSCVCYTFNFAEVKMLSCGRSLIDVVSHFPYISDNDGEVIDKNPTSELT